MRVTLANKIFVGFACLSLLTILLGLTTFTFIKQTEKSQEKIRLLQEFDLRIQYLNSITETADEHTHDPEMIREQFLRSVDIIEDISRKILSDEPCPYSIETDREDKSCRESTLGTLSSYRQAAVDFFDSLFLAEKIGFKNLLLYRKLSTEVSKIPLSSKRISAIDIIHKLEVYKHAFQESNDPEQINRMKKALKSFQNLKVDKALSGMAEMFVNINEQAYFNTISLKEQGKFLNQTSGQLTEISTRAHDSISQSNLSKQQQIKATALGLGLCSIAMTLLFWLLITKRLSTFLRNQKNAISSIKTGKYNYEINSKYNDELVELNNFIKTLAASLSEEISGREKSQQEKKELQYQLTQAQKLESIGLLAGGVAHDFNNLLTGIGGYSELALAQLEDNHPAKRYVEIISQSGQKAEELTRQLLAFSRKQELNKQIVNANSLVINLTKMMKRMIGEDIALELKTAADLPNIMADPGLIEQILMNLAVNARDAMPQGGKLTITTRALTLGRSATTNLEGVDPGDFVQVSVTDDGAGMAPEVKERIFDPFFTTKGTDRGSGLGLATVFGIVRQHNGHITVESEPDKGTTFNFFLPVVVMDGSRDATSPKKESSSARIKTARGNEIILLVDDNDTAREFICEALELCGYKVLPAENGQGALKIINQTDYTIDLLITDVVMPGMSGTDLAKTVRQALPDIKVIFMSGYTDRDLNLESVAAEANSDFLKKPLSVETLTGKVRALLDL